MAVEIIITDSTLTADNITDSGFDVIFQQASVSYDVSATLVDTPEIVASEVGIVVSASGTLVDVPEILSAQTVAQASIGGALTDNEEVISVLIGDFDIALIEVDSVFRDISVSSTIKDITFKSTL